MTEYDWPDVNWERLYRHRLENAKKVMKDRQLDALILTCADNIRYCTQVRTTMHPEHFNDEFAAIIAANGDCYIYGFWLGKSETMPWIKDVVSMKSWSPSIMLAPVWASEFAKRIEKLKAKRVGIEHLPFQILRRLEQDLPRTEFVSAFEDLLSIRTVKSEDEIKLHESSATAVTSGAFAGLRALNVGATEYEVATVIGKRMRELGVEYVTHVILISGRSYAVPYVSNRNLKPGDNVSFDIGCYGKGGYAADIARTGFVGKPSKELTDAYNTVIDSYREALKKIRPGVKAFEIDDVICKFLRESGYPEPEFGNGHGIGLRTLELPFINKAGTFGSDMQLQAGMILAVEPETVVNGLSVKHEEDVLVTGNGCRQLTGGEDYS